MVRKIIKIDEELCSGCGLCAWACHENAISMVDGKAKLLRDDYCDGLGNCLPVCPTGAITFEEREAAAFDKEAVKAAQNNHTEQMPLLCGCPGVSVRSQNRRIHQQETAPENTASELQQWPVQIRLLPVNASYFQGAHLLITADCAAYACGDFHRKFMKNKITIIGCPKLDDADYSEKLTEIIVKNNIKSVTVVRLEVPCCGGIEKAAITALKNSGKFLPWQVVTLTTSGETVEA